MLWLYTLNVYVLYGVDIIYIKYPPFCLYCDVLVSHLQFATVYKARDAVNDTIVAVKKVNCVVLHFDPVYYLDSM
jgi:hypothetical protein